MNANEYMNEYGQPNTDQIELVEVQYTVLDDGHYHSTWVPFAFAELKTMNSDECTAVIASMVLPAVLEQIMSVHRHTIVVTTTNQESE